MIEKEVCDTTSERKVAGLKFLLMVSRSVATRRMAEKDACKADLQECRAALDAKTVEIDTLQAEESSETSTQVSETTIQRI